MNKLLTPDEALAAMDAIMAEGDRETDEKRARQEEALARHQRSVNFAYAWDHGRRNPTRGMTDEEVRERHEEYLRTLAGGW
jgi:hypothetical protein